MMSEYKRRRAPLGLAIVTAALLLVSCGSNPISRTVSGVFGGGDDDKKKDENVPADDDRISILAFDETLEADPRFAGKLIDLPPAYKNTSWTQPGGEADHTLHHLTAEANFKTAWKADVGKASERAVLTSPPIAADGKVYVVDAAANVTAYSLQTGERVWRTELTPDIDEKFRVQELFTRPRAAEIGFGGGVAFDSGRIFVTSGFGFVAALNAETGEEIWRTATGAPVRTPPTAFRGSVYLVTNTNEFISLKQENGEKNWSYQSFEESARILSSASPAAAGDLVVAPFSSGEIVAFLAENGRPAWNDTLAKTTRLTALSTLNDIAGSPVIDRGLIYVVSHAGRLVAIDIRTGQRVWEVPIASLQMPWVAGDYIFVISVDAELACISRDEGAVVWVAKLPRYKKVKKRRGRIAWAGPVLAGDNLILVSTEGDIVKVSAQDGAILDEKEVGEGFIISPIVAEDLILVLSEEGKLIALR